MKKRIFSFVFGLLILAVIPCFAQEDASLAVPAVDPMQGGRTFAHQQVVAPTIEISRTQAIRDEVKALREERLQKMPFLSRGVVRDSIDKKRIESRRSFANADQKKLQELINRAIETNLSSKAADERVSLAKRRIMVAVRELFPEFSFNYEDREGLQTGGEFNSRGYGFVLRQPIFRGGILWNTMLAEIAEMRAAEKEHEKLVSDLINDISEAYFEFNRANQVVLDQQEAITKMEHYAALSERKFKEELISEIEHLNVQSLFSQMNYDFETSKQELELAKLDMQSFLDLRIDDDIEVAPLYDMQVLLAGNRAEDELGDPLEEDAEGLDSQKAVVPGGIESLPSLVDMAYAHRSELQVESAKLDASRMRERAKWGELLPRADVVVEAGALGEAFDSVAIDPKRKKDYRILLEFAWNMGGNTARYDFENNSSAPTVTEFPAGGSQVTRNTMTLNLFDGLEALADIKEAEADKLDQIIELENAEKEVIQDVKQAYFDYQKALIQFKSSLQRLDYRQRLAQLSNHRLEQNEVQISEYLQAEIDFLQEQTEFHRALKEYFAAKSALNRAVGIRDYLPIEETYGQ
jgi:outer membrane protein TolC